MPGGGRELGESEEECVIRELREETHLDVTVDGLLIDGPSHRHSPYGRFKIYLCSHTGGIVRPDGVETTDVAWFDLRSHDQMALAIVNNETTHDTLQRIRKALGDPLSWDDRRCVAKHQTDGPAPTLPLWRLMLDLTEALACTAGRTEATIEQLS